MPKKHAPHIDDALRRQTKSLSIDRQRSFHIVRPDSHHGDTWLHHYPHGPVHAHEEQES
jgi:hypothetical protein